MPRVKLEQDADLLRRAEYDKAGLTIEALAIALIENDPAELARIRAARADVKRKYPKGAAKK